MLDAKMRAIAINDPKAFLQQYKNLYVKLHMIKNELDIEKETAGSDARMRELLAEAKAITAERTEIYNLVNEKLTDDKERYVLCAHFLQGQTIAQIADALEVGVRYTQILQARALKSFSAAMRNS